MTEIADVPGASAFLPGALAGTPSCTPCSSVRSSASGRACS